MVLYINIDLYGKVLESVMNSMSGMVSLQMCIYQMYYGLTVYYFSISVINGVSLS